MNIIITLIVTFLAGMGAGLGTGFAGMSAAAGNKPYAYYISWHRALHGSRNSPVI